jgi:hypothetical protein
MVKTEINVYKLRDSSINIYFKDKNKNKLVRILGVRVDFKG